MHEGLDRLGADVIQSIAMMEKNQLVWMDLCSMCQDNVLMGYDYHLHTRPVVEKLHSIVKKAAQGCILLNENELIL